MLHSALARRPWRGRDRNAVRRRVLSARNAGFCSLVRCAWRGAGPVHLHLSVEALEPRSSYTDHASLEMERGVRESWQERFAETPDVLAGAGPPADHCAGPRLLSRRGRVHHHGGTVFGGNRAPAPRNCAPRSPRRRARPSRRRLQAAQFSLLISGFGPGGPETARRGSAKQPAWPL